jgi:MoxR-like ATPase
MENSLNPHQHLAPVTGVSNADSRPVSGQGDAFAKAADVCERIRQGLARVIQGRDDTVRLILTALMADGHVLLEDYPGSGKTTLTKTLGRLIAADHPDVRGAFGQVPPHILPFRRIQFTPDLLPGDVLGVNVFDPKSGQFHFMHGPVFAHILLADEINRTGPKVQAAFLECMAEKQVTIDNVTHPLDQLFFVVGTQNPLDIAGTYPLPIVQLDRFILKIPMTYVDRSTEIRILESHSELIQTADTIEPVCTRSEVLEARLVSQAIYIHPHLREAIVDIIHSTRGNPLIQYGASTRAALMLQSALKGWALVNGRSYAIEDDLKYIAPFVLSHRLKFHGGAGTAADALTELMRPALEQLIRKGVPRGFA